MAENGPQYFAEYSLWNDSAYSMFNIQPFNRIEFMRPVAGSIFLSPADFEDKDKDSGDEAEVQVLPPQPRMRNSPGFERYMRRALKVVTREDLLRDPAMFRKDPDSDDSESSLDRARDRELFLRPPRPRWRTPQQVNGRGRRMNLMQRRLEQALAQPARIERGASMMRCMGWEGGALGRGGGGIVEPIAPDPYYVRMLNAAYAHTTAGLGLPQDSAAESTDSDTAITKRSRSHQHQKTKKIKKQEFVLNVLMYIREFVKNDLQIEMFFEPRLKPAERKHIHQIVSKLMGEESEMEFDRIEMVHLVDDIERRNNYTLGTQSQGDAPHRQICVYKEATESMYLVTPDDVRAPQPPELEEETNPFLKSIVRHLKSDAPPPREYTMMDRIIDFFVEFSECDEYTEFRFLGAYNIDEIDVMSSFFGMVTCLNEKRPYLDYPERLVQAFEKGIDYTASEDANGFVSIHKWFRAKEPAKTEEKTEEPVQKIEENPVQKIEENPEQKIEEKPEQQVEKPVPEPEEKEINAVNITEKNSVQNTTKEEAKM